MVRDQHLNTRITPEAYKNLLNKCADRGCTPYTYLRELIHADVKPDVLEEPEDLGEEEPVPEEEENEDERNNIEKRYKIVG